MKATVDSLIRIHPGKKRGLAVNIPKFDKVIERIRQALTIKNPEYYKKQRMGLSTWNVPEELCYLHQCQDGSWTAPRGTDTATVIKKACPNVQFIDARILFPAVELPFSFGLRDYQHAAVDVLARRYQGIAQAPCGAGKTVLGAGLVARCGQPSLILVHTRDLVEQWRQTFWDAMGCRCGIIADGEQHIGPVTVATVQSLYKLPPQEMARIGRGFGLVLVDEAHHTPAATFTGILRMLPARYRVGVTATPTREDGLTPLIGLTIGPVIYEIGHQDLVDAGHLVVPEVVKVETGVFADGDDYAGMIKSLTTSTERLMKTAVVAADAGDRTTLILSNRVDYCEKITSMLCNFGHDAEAISGKTPKKKRASALQRFKDGDLKILVATQLADEGLDVSRLECLILALPSRAEGRTIQRLGRLMRPHKGKLRPVLYDLVDDHPIAEKQWKARRRAYRKVLGKGAVA